MTLVSENNHLITHLPIVMLFETRHDDTMQTISVSAFPDHNCKQLWFVVA